MTLIRLAISALRLRTKEPARRGEEEASRQAHRDPSANRPRLPKKELDELVKAAWDAGWWCKRSGKNYILCYPPDGSRMVRVPSTPSSMYRVNHVRRAMARAGLDV